METLKLRGSQVAVVVSMALLMVGATASGAGADSGGGAVREGGVSLAACSSRNGGTWCQGTASDGALKACYSNYVHPSRYHSSTASMGGAVSKRFATAGYWSRARVTAGWAHTCYTYWNSNA